MKNKGFTLIELLAVIIILGILMLIAIPSVTNYINNSRKNTYLTTVDELIKGTMAKTNSGELDIHETKTTYYVPCTCIDLENGKAKSPYGEFDAAYVIVTFDGKKYNYYFTGKDVQNMGVPAITKSDLLSKESIVANVGTIDTSVGIEGTNKVSIFDAECKEIEETKTAISIVTGYEGTSGGSGEEGSGGSGGGSTTTAVSQLQSDGTCPLTGKICKRASTSSLHSEECDVNAISGYSNGVPYGLGCLSAGYYDGGSKGTTTVTYGNKTTTSGVLTTGDAFDCDINCDGVYDPKTERFYYVTDYFDTSTKTFDSNYAVLMYSTNFIYGRPEVGAPGNYFTYFDAVDAVPSVEQGNTSYPNYVGPVTGVKHLPKISGLHPWRNDLLKTRTRRIYSANYTGYSTYTEPQTTACGGQELPTAFSYAGNAARLITVFEVSNGCVIDKYTSAILSKCEFMYEGTYYTQKKYSGLVWFENPAVHGTGNIYNVGGGNYISYTDGNNGGSIKPTIELLKTKIEY